MRIAFIILATATLLFSCEKKSSETQQSDSTVQNSQNAIPPADNAAGADGSAAVSTSGDIRPTLNPEHGQPYHRCDIEVGAPLNSAPQTAAPQALAPQTVSPGFNTAPIAPAGSPAPSSLQNVGPKPALNPAHGEPHHRCDIQVGAPLI